MACRRCLQGDKIFANGSAACPRSIEQSFGTDEGATPHFVHLVYDSVAVAQYEPSPVPACDTASDRTVSQPRKSADGALRAARLPRRRAGQPRDPDWGTTSYSGHRERQDPRYGFKASLSGLAFPSVAASETLNPHQPSGTPTGK